MPDEQPRFPLQVTWREVGVEMVTERARPGVEYGEYAECATDPGRVIGERLDGGRSFLEERGVDELLV